jgi:murein DD-endopeptidase MepM/ murein hydrolase activator NlpD
LKNLKKNLAFSFSFLLCLLCLTSCSDFASIFRKESSSSHRKTPSRGKEIALKKTRGGQGKILKGFFVWPVQGEVSSDFGNRSGRPHDGLDIRAEKGTTVIASASGEVAYAGSLHGYGNLVLIRHSNGYFTAYAHNDKNLVKEGKTVEQGEKIAEVGGTGDATGHHLHFEIREGSTPLDPLLFLPPD